MNDKIKNVVIIILLLVIAFLSWALFEQSHGRYCKKIVPEYKK